MLALTSLDRNLLDIILNHLPLMAALRLTSTCKTLRARAYDYLEKTESSAAVLKLAQQKLHARDFGIRDDCTSSKHQALRVLAAQEFDAWDGGCNEENAVRNLPFAPTWEDESEEDMAYGQAVVSIVFGFRIKYDLLRMRLMLGRRWWFTSGKICGHSQSLDEEPYALVQGYGDVEPRPPVKNEDYFDMLEEADYVRAKETTKYVMKYILEDAFDSHMKRAGLVVGCKLAESTADFTVSDYVTSMQEDSHIGIHCTGFQDHAGDEVIIGIQLGPQLPGLGFDMQSQCERLFFDPFDPIVQLADDPDTFVTGLLGLKDDWTERSILYSAIWCELHNRLGEFCSKTPSLHPLLSFFAVRNENC